MENVDPRLKPSKTVYAPCMASGVDPAALVDVINDAQAERAAARAQLDPTWLKLVRSSGLADARERFV